MESSELKLKFNILMVVWGAPYIEVMVRLTIPTLLYPGNIPALAARHQCKVIFFTRASDEVLIREAESVQRLAELLPIEFVHFDPEAAPNIYLAMSDAHKAGCLSAKDEGAKVIVASPDGLFADGCCSAIARQAELGRAAVMCSGLRLLQEEVLAVLPSRISTPIAPREMVSLTVDYLHPESERYSVESKNFYPIPSQLIWPMGRKGFLMRSFHLHPLMIDVSKIASFEALSEQSIDGALLGRTMDEWSDIHVVTDSDELYVCSMTPRDAFYIASTSESFSIERVHKAAYFSMMNDLHRFFFTMVQKLHTEDLDSSWDDAARATQWVVEAVRLPPPQEPEKVIKKGEEQETVPSGGWIRSAVRALQTWFGRT